MTTIINAANGLRAEAEWLRVNEHDATTNNESYLRSSLGSRKREVNRACCVARGYSPSLYSRLCEIGDELYVYPS